MDRSPAAANQGEPTVTITTENVAEAFDEAAPRYDLMVALNPGYRSHLRSAANALVERLPMDANPRRPVRVVDLGCGSGVSTRAVQRAVEAIGRRPEITAVDASAGMLAQASAKSWPAGTRFEVGKAEDLAWARESWGLGDRVPGAFAAYLLRNVTEPDVVLAAIFDLLHDDGNVVLQEYSVAGSIRSELIWSFVCWLVVIPLSYLTSRQTRLYRYLWRSVRSFDSVQTMVDRLYGAGFTDVEVRTVRGWQRGILHQFRARKPALAVESSESGLR
jgi:ubiquinone/menaquinone biosynthesis C-methylase UbiE